VGQGESEAEVLLGVDGNVTLNVGVLDQGAGVHVMQQQVVAEVLGIEPARVRVQVEDTNHAPYHDGIKGQGATHVTGQAVSRATQALIESLKARAAVHWDMDPTGLEWKEGQVWLANERRSLDLKQLAALAPGEPGRGFAYYDGRVRPREHIFQAVIADVEVDRDSGQIEVRRLQSFHDVSVVINSLTHQGQIDGGMMQGLGMALCEEVGVEDGRVTTLSLGDYKIPNVRDVPIRQTTLVEGATHGPGPFQAKPAAEHAITPIPPAVGNAVFNATGVRLTRLPLSAETVSTELRRRSEAKTRK
jgi:CO/xanthine dehydrogenase Mo-binding subunit